MDYKTMRDRIEDMVNDNHKDFVKAVISMEKGINDESALDKLYEAYMDNDTVNLLHEEFDSGTYEDVVKNKGITRSEFDKMLNAHKKESKNGINETQEYINNLSFAKRRRYNTALGNILETQQSESLRLIKIKIYNYIVEHEDSLDDIESYLKEISKLFDDDFDVEFTDDMKSVQYIMIYYMYASGGIL